MRTLIWIFFLFFLVLIQASLIPLVAFHGIEPDLLLIAVTSAGILRGREVGVSIGFFAGTLQDLASGGIIGSNALAKMLTGFVAGRLERKVFKENIFLPIIATVGATLLHSFIFLALCHIVDYKIIFPDFILQHLGPLIAYNVIFAVPIHHLVYRLSMYEA